MSIPGKATVPGAVRNKRDNLKIVCDSYCRITDDDDYTVTKEMQFDNK